MCVHLYTPREIRKLLRVTLKRDHGSLVTLAPGAGLELVTPIINKVPLPPTMVDVTPFLAGGLSEPLYALRPVILGGLPTWLGDGPSGPYGVPLTHATGIVLLLCGEHQTAEVRYREAVLDLL